MNTSQKTVAGASWSSTIVVAIALAGGWSAPRSWGGQPEQSQQPAALPTEPWQLNQIIKPEELAKSLSDGAGEKPLVLYVGFPVLYRGAHIVGSRFMGPGSRPEGIQALKQEVRDLPRDNQVVLYCGCCPWKDCPNIRPAFRAMQELGFKNVKLLDLPRNFQQDWIAKGFPVQKGDDPR